VCLDTGTIPSKTIREAVLSFSGNDGALGRRGIHPPPDAEHLLERVAHVVGQEAAVIEHQLRRKGVEVIAGPPSFLAPPTPPLTLVIRAGDSWREVTAKNVLLAVGTVPTPSPGMAPDGMSIVTSDDIVRLPRIPKTMTVVGAGVIGTEYASIFAALGVAVTLV